MRYRIVEECPFCGDESGNWSIGIQPMKPQEALAYERDETRYSICGCGGAFQNPMPTTTTLEGFYKNTYRSLSYRDDGSRADRVFPYLPSTRGTMLDVGCSSGKLMELAKDRGWCVTGVELGGVERKEAERFGPVFPDLGQVVGVFDLVTAIHVLEHSPAPIDFLRQIALHLGPGGTVLVFVPKNSYRPPHLVVMAEPQVRLLFDRAGLTIDELHTVETKTDTKSDIIVRAH